jgi:hypothetical protein
VRILFCVLLLKYVAGLSDMSVAILTTKYRRIRADSAENVEFRPVLNGVKGEKKDKKVLMKDTVVNGVEDRKKGETLKKLLMMEI